MKFFSAISKHKKITIFILLFFIISGIILPNIALGFIDPITFGLSLWTTYKASSWLLGHGLDIAITNVANGMILAVNGIAMTVTGILAAFAHTLLQGIISIPMKVGDYVFGSSYTHITGPDANIAVAIGWPIVRDLANMFVVLGFVIIGIATTLRIQEYQAKKLLSKLIIVALLINFSLLICGIFIDASNITINHFLNNGQSGYFGDSFVKSILNQVNIVRSAFDTDVTDPLSLMGMTTGFIFSNIVAFIIFTLFFFLFLFRYMALWILVILSPLAFVCYVFPFTKKFFEMWWNNFFQWCIIGIPAAFFLFLADKITEQAIPASTTFDNIDFATYFVPGFLLIAGFIFSLQTSAMGAGAAIKAFKGTGKFTGKAISKSKLGDIGRGTKNLASKVGGGMLERIGVAGTGTKSRIAGSAVDKAQKDKKMDLHTDDEVLKQIDKRGATGAAAVKEATKRKILNQYAGGDVDQLAERVAHAEGWGVDRSNAEKLVPELARHNTKRVSELEGIVNPDTGANYTTPEAKRQAVRERNQRQGPSNLMDMAPPQLNAHLAEDTSYSTMRKARESMTPEQKNQWESNARPHLESLFIAIVNEPNAAGVIVPPTDPTHPKHEKYVELGRKILEIKRK